MFHPQAELGIARAFSKAGLMFGLSTFSTESLENVSAAAADGPRLFQLYFLHEDYIMEELIQAAKDARFDALCVTLDLPVQPVRPKFERWHVLRSRPPARTVWDLARHPRYALSQFSVRKRPQVDVVRRIAMAGHVLRPDFFTNAVRMNVNWADVGRVAKQWEGPFAVKGVMCAEDAKRAVEAGATALIVCNHGGISLDGASSTLSVIGEVAAAVGPDIQIIQTGGARRGGDILKGIALGASAIMTARPFLAGLAVAGEAGVAHAIKLFREDFVTAMKLTGCRTVAEINSAALVQR